MHLNEFRRTLMPGDEVSFYNRKKYVNGKVKAVKDTLITIEVDEAGETKTYHEHRKLLCPPIETGSWFERCYGG